MLERTGVVARLAEGAGVWAASKAGVTATIEIRNRLRIRLSTPQPLSRFVYFLVVSVLGTGTTEPGCPAFVVESVARRTFAASSSTWSKVSLLIV